MVVQTLLRCRPQMNCPRPAKITVPPPGPFSPTLQVPPWAQVGTRGVGVMTFSVGRILMMLMLGSGVLVRSEGNGLELDDGLEVRLALEVAVELGVGVVVVVAVELWVELGVAVGT